MTIAGAARLRAELQELKVAARPRVIAAIAEARAHGDLKENAEYHAAREQQGFIEGRIAEIESKLAHAQVIDVTALPPSDKVVFGATVRLIEEDREEEKCYQIVGEDEAAIKEGKISFGSPIARAMFGKAAAIVEAILDGRSPRLSAIAQHMAGTAAANYKAIQRFIAHVDVKAALLRLFQDNAEFVIGDATEMSRPQAYRTSYVGTLSDGETHGYWLLVFATPFRGRALPCSLLRYSSRTIAQGAGSRNLCHWQIFDELKALLGDKPLVLDRDFSYLELLQYCVHAGINFVIRLNMRSQPPKFYTAEGRQVTPMLGIGQKGVYYQLRYRNQVTVNIIGVWRYGTPEPLWVMSNLEPERARLALAEDLEGDRLPDVPESDHPRQLRGIEDPLAV